MSESISIELQESPTHAFLDVAVTIMGERHTLNRSFTHQDHAVVNDTVAQLRNAAQRIKLKDKDDSIIVETAVGPGCSEVFAIKANEPDVHQVIFEHLKSLTKLNGLKII